MLNKIPSCRHALQKKSANFRGLEGRFTKRIHGLARFIPKAHLRDTYLVMQETMSLESRVSFTAVRELADRRGVDVRTFQRHLVELVKLRVVQVTRRKYARLSNHTNRYTFPLLNEDFLRVNLVSRGGGARVTVKTFSEIEKQTTTPRAPEARRRGHVWTPDREGPKKPETEPFTRWREWRQRCERRRIETQSAASVGASYSVDTRTEEQKRADDAANEAWRRDYDRREELRKQQEREAAEQRKQVYGAYVERIKREAAEPPDAELQARIDALNRRLGIRV